MDIVAILKRLSESDGIVGHEGPVREVIREVWQPFVDELRADRVGNLIALKRGTERPSPLKLMLAAHMDEVGLVVTGIEKGFLRIGRVGGADIRVLPGREVIVHGRRSLPGIIATRPPHVTTEEERQKPIPWDKLFVDVGLPPAEVERLVRVGDLVSIRAEMRELRNRRVAGKALDDRACVAVIALALEELAHIQHVCDVFAVATVQEEVGVKGAITSAFGIAPDLAIALDVTFAEQPGVTENEGFPLGSGPAIGIGPNFHPMLVQELRRVAEEQEIAHRTEVIPGHSGTDAWAIQVSREGVPTALISVPLRYMHQPIETLAVQDIERASRLLVAFIAKMTADFLAKIAWPT